jgi:hypothetical protein
MNHANRLPIGSRTFCLCTASRTLLASAAMSLSFFGIANADVASVRAAVADVKVVPQDAQFVTQPVKTMAVPPLFGEAEAKAKAELKPVQDIVQFASHDVPNRMAKEPERPAALRSAPLIPTDRIFTDVSPDGTIWVRGIDYKASFNADGATFIPFLGSDAPRNEPVKFQLQSATVNGRPLAFDADAKPMLLDSQVHFARGPFTEVYELSPASIEQLFILDESLGGGDLQLIMAVETELDRDETADHLTFTNDRGGVTYTRAIVKDAANRLVAAPTKRLGDRIQIVVPASFLATATYPVTVDPVISTFSVANSTVGHLNPDVAYDASLHRYIVTWEIPFSAADGDIWAQLHDANGALISSSGEFIDFTSNNWRRPRVAHNRVSIQFMVVAQVGTAPGSQIWGRARVAGGNLMGDQFHIGNGMNADIGGDPYWVGPSYYLVVWEFVPAPGIDHDIFARRVAPDNTLGDLILLDTTGGLNRFPSISKSCGAPPFSSQRWTVVWQRQFNPIDQDIYGAQIAWNGVVVHPAFIVNASGSNEERPTVTSLLDESSNRRYLVAYEQGLGEERIIHGRVFEGTTMIAQGNLSQLSEGGTLTNYIEPHADSDGTRFAVTYARLWAGIDYDIYLSTFCVANGKITRIEGHRNLALSGSAERLPRIVAKHSGGEESSSYLVAWTDHSPDTGGIEAGTYDNMPCCPADISPAVGDSVVNVSDLLALLAAWGPCAGCAADLNGDGQVNVSDLLALLSAWGQCS